MKLNIDEKRVLVRILEKIKPANLQEIKLVKDLTRSFQQEIDAEQASIMFPIKNYTLLKAA